jgi:hypothetical protein
MNVFRPAYFAKAPTRFYMKIFSYPSYDTQPALE